MQMTYGEVADVLERFAEGKGNKWDWDDFTSGPILDDAFLKEIQTRCCTLGAEFPPERKGSYCGPGGLDVLRGYVKELRVRSLDQA